jgi:hypothetical protein
MDWRKMLLLAGVATAVGASGALAQAQKPGFGSTAGAVLSAEPPPRKETLEDQMAEARIDRQTRWPRMGSPSGGHPGGADAGKNSVPMEANRYK